MGRRGARDASPGRDGQALERCVQRERPQPRGALLVAGRVDGSAERPQLLPLSKLEIELYRGKRRVGTLVRLRDVLPGRYAFGLTGRGPRGARLRSGAYVLRVLGVPVGGGRATSETVPFRLR